MVPGKDPPFREGYHFEASREPAHAGPEDRAPVRLPVVSPGLQSTAPGDSRPKAVRGSAPALYTRSGMHARSFAEHDSQRI